MMPGFESKRAMAQDKLTEYGMKKVFVQTTLMQELEVPESWEKEDVFDFLAEHQSFRTAFQGVSNEDQTARILDVGVIDDEVTEETEDE